MLSRDSKRKGVVFYYGNMCTETFHAININFTQVTVLRKGNLGKPEFQTETKIMIA